MIATQTNTRVVGGMRCNAVSRVSAHLLNPWHIGLQADRMTRQWQITAPRHTATGEMWAELVILSDVCVFVTCSPLTLASSPA
jgi:hypothetical protein